MPQPTNPPQDAAKSDKAPRDKGEAFKRVAVRRTVQTVVALRGLAKVANRNVYDYTDEQRDKILSTVETELANVREAFTEGTAGKDEIGFTL